MTVVNDTVDNAKATPEIEQPYAELGLRDDEYQKIKEILGRRPTDAELTVYSVMWSAHCSYKSSKVHLRSFGETMTEEMASKILAGIGENAGVVDIGGGATDAALISAGGIVVSEAIPVAGDAMDAAIARFIRDKHHVMIGERTAETVKIRLGSVLDPEVLERVEVKGRNMADGLPARVYLTRDDLAQAIAPVLQKIADTVHRLLAETPPELSADLFDKGIILTGGGSLVRGLGPLIEEENGIRVRYAEQAVSCVVRGAGKALSWIRRFQATDAMLSDTTRQQTMNREILRKR